MKDKKLEAALTKKPEAPQEHPRIRTGCDLLDILLGGKAKTYGLEAGTILGVWGDSGAGKSFVINEMIAANHYRNPKKFRWLNSDGENGNKFDCPKLYGFEISSEGKPLSGFVKGERGALKPATITFHHSTTVQEMDAHVSLFLSGLKDDEYAIYAQDSLDSVKDAGAEEAAQERLSKLVQGKEVVNKGSYNMGKQKSLSAFFADHVDELERKNCLLILTSQYRAKIGSPIPGQKTVTGGYSLKYYCHTILDLALIKKIEVGGKWIGSVVRARTKNKARTERPGREVYYVVYFTRGIDNVGSNIDYLYNLRDKDGNLVNDEVSWGGAMPDLKAVTAWLNDTGKMAEYKEFAYKVIGRRAVNLDVVYQWAALGVKAEDGSVVEAPACPEEYGAKFGRKMTRDELRALCGSDPEARRRLREMVIEKWEAAEAEAEAAVGFEKVFDNFD